MLYKKFMYTLLLVVVISFVISCDPGGTTTEETSVGADTLKPAETPSDRGLGEAYSEYWQHKRVNTNTGQFISKIDAEKKFKNFKAFRNGTPAFKNQPYGFALGTEKIQELLDK
ncbi:MAG: hypothetical protein OEX02_11620, partial [Cyclobacteriaceae bacterium]|nr:hypothetical protein [Cyclobacteriaceae bacterium]